MEESCGENSNDAGLQVPVYARYIVRWPQKRSTGARIPGSGLKNYSPLHHPASFGRRSKRQKEPVILENMRLSRNAGVAEWQTLRT